MQYHLGDIKFPMLTCADTAGDLGVIRIGGDRGDIVASDASNYDDGVVLHGAFLGTSHENLCPAGQVEMAQEIVYACFESIGVEAFIKQRARTWQDVEQAVWLAAADDEEDERITREIEDMLYE